VLVWKTTQLMMTSDEDGHGGTRRGNINIDIDAALSRLEVEVAAHEAGR